MIIEQSLHYYKVVIRVEIKNLEIWRHEKARVKNQMRLNTHVTIYAKMLEMMGRKKRQREKCSIGEGRKVFVTLVGCQGKAASLRYSTI